jgi:hypothetical protein
MIRTNTHGNFCNAPTGNEVIYKAICAKKIVITMECREENFDKSKKNFDFSKTTTKFVGSC